MKLELLVIANQNVAVNTFPFGAVLSKDMADEIRITVVATGFEEAAQTAKGNIRDFPVRTFSSEDIDIPAFLRRR